MTVSTTTRSITYTGNGVTVDFAIPFYWITNFQIVVQRRTIAGGALVYLTEGADYTLTGVGDMAGGSLIMLAAPSSAFEIIISRTVPILQLENFVANDALAAETIERDYDYLTMICQQLSDSIAALGVGSVYSFQNVGAGQGHIYAGISGSTVQLKTLKQAGGMTITETATEIQLSSSASGIDLTADYAWTGRHTHTKQAARTLPSFIVKSLQGGVDIADSSILLGSDYVAAIDVRKRTAVATEAPVDGSWGGNAGVYIQHSASGTTGVFGTLTAGIRAQMETTQVHGGGPIVNDSVAGYFGIYNNGTDVGGFGIHADAYHAGTAGAAGHSTVGMSMEMHKTITGGVAAGVVVRTLGAQPLDYGFLYTHSAGGINRMYRGLQLGSPAYAQGGIQGAPGFKTLFDVGIDLTWGDYGYQAIAIPRDTAVGFSGINQAQSAIPDRTCEMRWQSSTGNFWFQNNGLFRFGVNMTTGNLFGPATNEMLSLWNAGTPWALSMTSTNKVSNTANAGAQVAGVTATSLRSADLAGFIVWKIDGIACKVPYFAP